MGKAKPRHKRNRRHNNNELHTGIPSLKKADDDESDVLGQPLHESALHNIMEEIQSAKIEDKLCGLQSLVSLSEKSDLVESILRLKMLKVVGPCLIDKNPEVRNLTAGLIRNLSACGSADICERLVKDDIMTPMIAVFNQYSDWKPESSTSENTDTLIQLVHILWNLCENDETVLKYYNSPDILNLILRFLDYGTVGLDLTIVACQCLSSMSEDNADVISALRRDEVKLLDILPTSTEDNKLLLLKIIVAGIIVNINPSSEWLPSVLSVLDEVLTKDVRTVAGKLSSELPLETPAPSPTLPVELQTMLDAAEALVDAQIRGLEILTNLTASQDDEMDVEESASDDEDEINGWCETDDTLLLLLSPEILEGLGKYKLIQKVIGKIEPLPENVMDIINHCYNSKSLSKKLVRLQCRALLCINNLVAVADVDDMGGPDNLFSLAIQISSKCLSTDHQAITDLNIELVESSTSAIRAVMLRLASINYVLKQAAPSDLEAVFEIGRIEDAQVQVNVIRIAGTLGALLVNGDSALVKMSANYLMEWAEKQHTLWLTAEAVDSLMDMFADDGTDRLAAEIGLVPRLQALAPRIKAKMRHDRKTLGDHYPVVSTVVTNLNPFIKYKAARVAALK